MGTDIIPISASARATSTPASRRPDSSTALTGATLCGGRRRRAERRRPDRGVGFPNAACTARSTTSDHGTVIICANGRSDDRGRRRPPPERGPSCRADGSVAGELLAQRGPRLVGGEGAAVVGRLGGVGRRRAAALDRSLRLGLLGLIDLLHVRVVAGARLGVLPLPLGLLGLVARQPLVGLRVEAIGVLVVALGVVGG